MLKINLLTVVRDAENEYRKMLAGEDCDYLTMFEDRTVRRRVHQNARNEQKRAALLIERASRQEGKIKSQLERRKGMSAIGTVTGFLGAHGEPMRDVRKELPWQTGKDRWSQGVLSKDLPVPPSVPKSNADRDVLADLDWAERQQKLSKNTKGPIKRHAKKVRRIINNLPHTIGDRFKMLPGMVSDKVTPPPTPPVQRKPVESSKVAWEFAKQYR